MDYNHEDQGETFDKATGAPVGHKPPKPIVIKTDDGSVELVQTNEGDERQFKRRSRYGKVTIVKMKDYAVLLDGKKVGRVFQGEQTFERKTPGRTYVNARWTNVRWFFELDKDPAFRTKYGERRSTDRETRKDAVESMLRWRARRLDDAAKLDPGQEFVDA